MSWFFFLEMCPVFQHLHQQHRWRRDHAETSRWERDGRDFNQGPGSYGHCIQCCPEAERHRDRLIQLCRKVTWRESCVKVSFIFRWILLIPWILSCCTLLITVLLSWRGWVAKSIVPCAVNILLIRLRYCQFVLREIGSAIPLIADSGSLWNHCRVVAKMLI